LRHAKNIRKFATKTGKDENQNKTKPRTRKEFELQVQLKILKSIFQVYKQFGLLARWYSVEIVKSPIEQS